MIGAYKDVAATKRARFADKRSRVRLDGTRRVYGADLTAERERVFARDGFRCRMLVTRREIAGGKLRARRVRCGRVVTLWTGELHHRKHGRGKKRDDGTRNLRNVWSFPTQPYSGAHFATFPEELPRRCILAATSAKGACRQCGAPWERVTRNKPMVIDRTNRGEMAGNRTMTSGTMVEPPSSQTIGWRPGCECRGQHGRTVPCVVLDPFGGSGTTGRVAIELNRVPILCDLAYGGGYEHLAAARTTNVQRELLQA